MQVIKRDGREVEFNVNKIVDAIKLAMIRTEQGIDEELATKISESVEKIEKKNLHVEEIQDMVEKKLMASSRKDVAKEFITYRNKRSENRHKNSELNKKIESILLCKNIQNSNANVDEYSFGGRKFESAGLLHKNFALNNLLREEVANAFLENRIYIHDFDSYDVGMSNCLFINLEKLLKEGFITRNGDVRGANSINTAMQLVAVIFQCQSQVQFGGVGSIHLDYDLAPYVAKSFLKLFSNGLFYFNKISNPKEYIIEQNLVDKIKLNNISELEKSYDEATKYALRELDKEGLQAAQALYHNLNTLESRPGSQLPFTSINFGRDTSIEGRKVSEWLLKASIDGIGKHHTTSIFPISIFQYKKGINNKPNTPNYNLKKLAIKSMCKRIYPNWVNGDFSNHKEDTNDINTFMSSMGCRTMIGYNRFDDNYNKIGRGNVSPVTINLPKIGIKHGICLNEISEPDIEGFWNELKEVLQLAVTGLVDRFYHICSQSVKSAPFMYKNGTIHDSEKALQNGIYESMKHGTQAIGYIGIAEMCQAMFSKNHAEDENVKEFGIQVVKFFNTFAKQASEEYNLNFSAYATPAENLCKTMMDGLKKEFGIIKNVTDRDYLTNSHHVPVWQKISIFDKLKTEAPFCQYPTGGCITYVELDSSIINNENAVESIIDFAMDMDIPYLAFNFPIDSCLDCGYQSEFNDKCPICGSENIQQLRRVTGYLTTDYRNFNAGKIAEVNDRIKHSEYTKF
jgi:ribonucleoside-triphosphate reductase